jgi:tRNA threonylcarbamoyladenosine biosynthesis protein TsaB
MALILSLETSTSSCSAALHRDGELLSGKDIHEPQLAASRLALLIDDVISESGVTARQIETVAVSAGPGSYTGLRIGVATAKGFCYAMQVPLVSINSLMLLAAQVVDAVDSGVLLCPMIDARRMEVYSMLFDTELQEVEPIAARVIDESSYREHLASRRVLFFGTGSDKCRDAIRHPNAEFVSGVIPSAASMGSLAEAKYRSREFEDVAGFEPFYLKDFLIRKPKSVV